MYRPDWAVVRVGPSSARVWAPSSIPDLTLTFPQLVRMVGSDQDTLDHAYHRHRYIWLRRDDNVVRPLRGRTEWHKKKPTSFPLCSLPIHLYLVDTFTYAASALSAASVRLSSLVPTWEVLSVLIDDDLHTGRPPGPYSPLRFPCLDLRCSTLWASASATHFSPC
jgi:hypothetical protein